MDNNNKIAKLQATDQALCEDLSDEQLSQVYGGLGLSNITGGFYSGAGDLYDNTYDDVEIIVDQTLAFLR